MARIELKLIPVLGRKTSVPPDDPSMFQWIGDTTALTHDAGGVNFDLERKKNACSKSYGKTEWSNSATAQATKCMGLAELDDGTNLNHIYCDNGKIYYYDSALDPQDISGGVTFANDSIDLYSFVKVGDYIVLADRAEHTPYKWKHADANVSKLIASGTEYKFRYLMTFQRRVFGLYSDQTDGDIDIRWSTSWPGTAIGSLNFPATNQLYVPNDDPITGGKTMGVDKAYIYCRDSIQRIVYFQDFETPFRIYTAVPQQGCPGHHSIVSLGNRHFLFNKNYGFVEYRGGQEFPYGGRPISADIEDIIQDFDVDFYSMIVGAAVPLTRQIAWAVPFTGDSTPSHILFYNYETGQWTIEDKAMRFISNWRMYDNFTWNNLITELGGTGATWNDAGTNTWAYYTSNRQRLAMSNTDGKLYYRAGETDAGSALDGYRIEPVVDFGNKYRRDLLQEIWFDIAYGGNFSIDVSWRGGDTTGELVDASWTSLGSVSCNDPTVPAIRNISQSARMHQIKWGTDAASEPWRVNGINLIAQTQSAN